MMVKGGVGYLTACLYIYGRYVMCSWYGLGNILSGAGSCQVVDVGAGFEGRDVEGGLSCGEL